jgi:hypothetical protein
MTKPESTSQPVFVGGDRPASANNHIETAAPGQDAIRRPPYPTVPKGNQGISPASGVIRTQSGPAPTPDAVP